MMRPSRETIGTADVCEGPADLAGTDVAGILDMINVPIVVVDGNCKIARFNQAASNQIGLSPPDIGRLAWEIRVLSEAKHLERSCGQAMADGVPCRCEIQNG